MRLAKILGLAISLTIGAGALHAEVRTQDPAAHAGHLLDLLEAEGAKSFSEAVADALDNKGASAVLPHVAPLEKRRAKFRAVALDRDYGGAIRHIIIYQYMMTEQYPFLYFRFVYKMTDTGWRLANFAFDSESSQPFPPKYGIYSMNS